jgi:hypothetical protein
MISRLSYGVEPANYLLMIIVPAKGYLA